MARIGQTVKRLRTRRGWSQRDLAKRARITQAYISQLEGGRKSNPTMAAVTRLAKALGVSPAALLG
jgi:transcriptional regulator with XRE-family HTH domain